MRRFSSHFVSSSFMAVALSIVVVGVVWASSAALQTSTTDTSVPASTTPSDEEKDGENGDEQTPGLDPASDVNDLRQRVVSLSAQVETLTKVVESLQADISDVESVSQKALSTADKASASAEKARSIANGAATDATEALELVKGVDGRVGVVELRTSKLNDEGVYSGEITPEQLSRKLSPADLSGDWPLNRVTGDLDVKYVLMPFSGSCSSRYGFYTVLITDGFRRITCDRIAAP